MNTNAPSPLRAASSTAPNQKPQKQIERRTTTPSLLTERPAIDSLEPKWEEAIGQATD